MPVSYRSRCFSLSTVSVKEFIMHYLAGCIFMDINDNSKVSNAFLRVQQFLYREFAVLRPVFSKKEHSSWLKQISAVNSIFNQL